MGVVTARVKAIANGREALANTGARPSGYNFRDSIKDTKGQRVQYIPPANKSNSIRKRFLPNQEYL